MKNSIALHLLALLVATAGSLAAAPRPIVAASHPVGAVERQGTIRIKAGNSQAEVHQALGMPDGILAGNVWFFRNFCGGHEQAPDDDCSILVVTFTNGRVSDLQLVNDRAVDILARRVAVTNRTNAKATLAMAK